MPEWFESYFAGLYGEVLEGLFSEDASDQQAGVVRRLLALDEGQRVLDIPCGMGRIAIPLARMGFAVTAVDLQPRFIRKARRRAAAGGLNIRFIEGDMREIEFESEFDAAFNWFTSFGYFSEDEDIAFLTKILAALKPGGRFLIDQVNKAWLVANFKESSEDTIGNVRTVERRRWDAAAGRVISEITYSKGTAAERHSVSIKVRSGAEMTALLAAAGFERIELFGSDGLGKPTAASPRLLALAERPQ